jgi:hypothetical protein
LLVIKASLQSLIRFEIGEVSNYVVTLQIAGVKSRVNSGSPIWRLRLGTTLRHRRTVVLTHGECLGDAPAAPATQRQQHRPRSVSLATITRSRQR